MMRLTNKMVANTRISTEHCITNTIETPTEWRGPPSQRFSAERARVTFFGNHGMDGSEMFETELVVREMRAMFFVRQLSNTLGGTQDDVDDRTAAMYYLLSDMKQIIEGVLWRLNITPLPLAIVNNCADSVDVIFPRALSIDDIRRVVTWARYSVFSALSPPEEQEDCWSNEL